MQTLLASGGKCPEYCGRIQFENATCGKCLWTTSPDPASDWSECRPCASPLSLYDWLYVALMSCAPIVLNAYAIDYYKTDKWYGQGWVYSHITPRILNVLHHVTSFIECALSFVCTLLILNPNGLPYLVGCNVSKLSDWYPMFYNPYIDYTEKLHCTQEIVHPLYSLPFIYYALCLVNLTVFRTILCCKYPFRKTGSNTAVYASLYILPIVTLVHAVFAGFIYYGFPYLLLIATLSTNAFYLSNYEQQNMKSLLKDTVTEPKNLLVVVFHCLCIAFCFVSIDLFRSPVMSIVMLLLTPIPTLFYVITINFSAPMP